MKNRTFITVLFILFTLHSFSQNNGDKISILFYNVENLFDTKNDPFTEDDEFTPDGDRHWTYNKLNRKLFHISKVILSASGWTPPTVVALCEIENRYVLEKLISTTPLKSQLYKIIHKESPDHRGIDVALLYNKNKFDPIKYNYFPLKDKHNLVMRTREILYVSGVVNGIDTIHFFINHWPSRYSGLLETQHSRNVAAKLLRQKVDEVFQKYNSPKIIIMGDFNDQPTDESVTDFLNAKEIKNKINNGELYNLSFNWLKNKRGTLKYQSQWSVFDQIIVSGELLNATKGCAAEVEDATIVNQSFLFVKDEKYGGKKPNRTYYGYTYKGGFSDHLPVLLQLKK
jgi:hypothetical protein